MIDLLGEGHGLTTFTVNVKTVTTAGVAESLASGFTPAKYIMLQANPENTLRAAVGDDDVDVYIATVRGLLLYPGERSTWIPITDLADVYVDVYADGEKVIYMFVN
uniref:Uncharacterized protein n=1 Tax=viral metagenome TaxID=1070528 RepID=A0A6M3INY2_9ZZZZ